MRYKCLLLLLLLCAIPAAAQDSKPGEPAPPGAASAPEPVVVRVLDAGAEPRRVLRCSPKTGSKSSLRMSMKMTTQMQVGDQPNRKVQIPRIIMDMDVDVLSVSENGDIRYDFKFTRVSVDDSDVESDLPEDALDTLRKSLKTMEGMGGTATTTGRGETKDVTMRLPEHLDPSLQAMLSSMKESMTQMSAPLPEEAVGVGARWEVQTHPRTTVRVDQIATMTLTKHVGDDFHIDLAVTQSAPQQEIEAPGSKVPVKLMKFATEGTGSIEGTFGVVVPSVSKMKLSTNITVESGTGKSKFRMKQRMDMNLAIVGGASQEVTTPPAGKK